MRRSTSFRDQGGIDTPPPPLPPKFADFCRVWAPPPPKGLIYQAKRHRTHPNTYFALKQRKLQLEKSSFRDERTYRLKARARKAVLVVELVVFLAGQRRQCNATNSFPQETL